MFGYPLTRRWWRSATTVFRDSRRHDKPGESKGAPNPRRVLLGLCVRQIVLRPPSYCLYQNRNREGSALPRQGSCPLQTGSGSCSPVLTIWQDMPILLFAECGPAAIGAYGPKARSAVPILLELEKIHQERARQCHQRNVRDRPDAPPPGATPPRLFY